MEITELLDIIKQEKGYELDNGQKKVIKYGNGPLWVVAGPGSGKTEVLVLRTLKLIFVDNFKPESIIITTFTEKAAKNLFERILNYSNLIFRKYPNLEQKIDLHELYIGTLHSLCNDIMLKNKYPDYENYRLLDELEQYLFIFEHSDFVRDNTDKYKPLCEHFSYLFDRFDPVTNGRTWNRENMPNKWRRTNVAIKIFNRVVEDNLDINKIEKAPKPWNLFLTAYKDYLQILKENGRCDFALLQQKFLQFLDTPLGSRFVLGDGSDIHPGIQYVLVDEYQDTNPIQEAIYLKLTSENHNLCVVGDDDQALYRFRGGTVDCMVTFKDACVKAFKIKANEVELKYLNTNYRSHPDIVHYYDEYINSFGSMKLKNARVEGKPKLLAKSKIKGDYPAVAYITGRTREIAAENFANFVDELLRNNIIENPSQCALLMRSVRDTQNWAKFYSQALQNKGITPYNPRSKDFLDNDEISGTLGAFISIIDPNFNALKTIGPSNIKSMVEKWVLVYEKISNNYPELSNYVDKSLKVINNTTKSKWLGVNILDIFYHIQSYEPFNSWRDDVERTFRLGQLSSIFETYASIPYPKFPGSERGELRTSSVDGGGISFGWRRTFYYALMGLLLSTGLDDPENEVIIAPPDRLPIMTVHQAKGLEFPFVFVYGLKQKVSIDDSIRLEDEFSKFRKNSPFVNFDQNVRAEQDMIRFYYVAFSRAKYSLIHMVPKTHLEDGFLGFIDKNKHKFIDNVKEVGD